MFADVAYQIKSPRTVLTNFDFGVPYGESGNKELHLEVIEKCLEVLENTKEPGEIVEL